jgi:hypothetical protein
MASCSYLCVFYIDRFLDMKKIVSSVALSMALLVPFVSEAATVTNNFSLGTFPSSAGLEDSTADGASGHKNLPGPVNSFIDNWSFTVRPGGGTSGAAQVSIVGASVKGFADIAAEIVAVSPLGVELDKPSIKVLSTNLGVLAAGNYIFRITGTVGATPSSYSGTLDIQGASAVPVPAAVWLFGSALIGVMGVSGRKKKLS